MNTIYDYEAKPKESGNPLAGVVIIGLVLWLCTGGCNGDAGYNAFVNAHTVTSFDQANGETKTIIVNNPSSLSDEEKGYLQRFKDEKALQDAELSGLINGIRAKGTNNMDDHDREFLRKYGN